LNAQTYDFNHVPGTQRVFRAGAFLHTTSPLIDLTEGFEAWRQARRAQGSAIKNAERKGRKLAREVGEVRFVANETDPAVWDHLLAWKRAALRAIDVSFILDRPWARAVIDRVRATDAAGFGGMTSALWAGDDLAAVNFSMRTDTTIHSWFPTYNPALERHSPGLTLLMETLRHAAAAGFTEVDLGRGAERYKSEFANAARGLCEGSIERGLSPLGAARKLRKAVQAAAERTGRAERAETARRVGNRLLSAGRLH
jgi:CelD/BcsL family acetyltransferase involved in cellulose biosynthesis